MPHPIPSISGAGLVGCWHGRLTFSVGERQLTVVGSAGSAATDPGRDRDGHVLRGVGRQHGHQNRPLDDLRNLGVSPGTAVTGFPPGVVTNGSIHSADAVAAQAQNDLTTAYNDAAGRTPAGAVTSDLGGQSLAPGVYKADSAMRSPGKGTGGVVISSRRA
jgi:Ice-binding-like